MLFCLIIIFLLLLFLPLAHKLLQCLKNWWHQTRETSPLRDEKVPEKKRLPPPEIYRESVFPLSTSLDRSRRALFSSDIETASSALIRLQEEGKAILYMCLTSRKKPLVLLPGALQNILILLLCSDREEFFRWLVKDYHEIRVPAVIGAVINTIIESANKGTLPESGAGGPLFLYKVLEDANTPYHLQAIRGLGFCGNTEDLPRLQRMYRYQSHYKRAIGEAIQTIKLRLRKQSSGWLTLAEKDSTHGSLSISKPRPASDRLSLHL